MSVERVTTSWRVNSAIITKLSYLDFRVIVFLYPIFFYNIFSGKYIQVYQRSTLDPCNSSVMRQRENIKKGVSRKHSTPNFPKNEHLLPPDTHTYVCVCVSGGKKCSIVEKFDVLCFLETLVLRFGLLPYYPGSGSVHIT